MIKAISTDKHWFCHRDAASQINPGPIALVKIVLHGEIDLCSSLRTNVISIRKVAACYEFVNARTTVSEG